MTTTTPKTTQESPVELPLRLDPDPAPVPGCAHCDTIAVDRDRAKANGDGSKRGDCNVRMRRHLEADH